MREFLAGISGAFNVVGFVVIGAIINSPNFHIEIIELVILGVVPFITIPLLLISSMFWKSSNSTNKSLRGTFVILITGIFVSVLTISQLYSLNLGNGLYVPISILANLICVHMGALLSDVRSFKFEKEYFRN